MLPKEACSTWFAGLDPAFSSDPFGLAIVGRDTSQHPPLAAARVRELLSAAVGGGVVRRPPRGDHQCVSRLSGCGQVATDQFSVAAVIDRLAKAGITAKLVSMNAASKTDVYTQLRGALYVGSLEIYEHPELLAELRRLRTRFSAGQSAVVNPRVGRSHGDMAQALALAAQIASVTGAGASTYCYRCSPGHATSGPNKRPCQPLDGEKSHVTEARPCRQRRSRSAVAGHFGVSRFRFWPHSVGGAVSLARDAFACSAHTRCPFETVVSFCQSCAAELS